MIYLGRGNFEYKYYRKRASVAYGQNSFVSLHTSDDEVTPSTSSSASVVGLCLQAVASTDSNYATQDRILVAVPLDSSSEFLCETSSDIAITDEGELHDLSDADTVDPAVSTNDNLRLKQFVSSRLGIYTLATRTV